MALLFASLIIITCVLLILIVLVQNPKGGGLSSSFGGSGTQLFGGVKKTTDFLDRGTWALAIVLVVLVLAANVTLTPSGTEQGVPDSKLLNSEMPQSQTPSNQPMPLNNGGGQMQGQQGNQQDLSLPEPVEEDQE